MLPVGTADFKLRIIELGRQIAYYLLVSSQLITRSPDVLGGTPVFAGTRVPVQTLIDYIKAGDSIDDFLAEFPSVSRDQVLASLTLKTEPQMNTDQDPISGTPAENLCKSVAPFLAQ